MASRKIKKNETGFSLIEVLVVVFIAAVIFTSFFTASTVGTKYIIESKNRLAAVALVNEKMEIVRNLEYEKVGTQESIDVSGSIPQEEAVTANGHQYLIATTVRYFDDPMDGTIESSPMDPIPNDYKVVRIVASWTGSDGQQQSVSSTSRFVPPGLETSVGGSPLSINVIDGETLLPIPQATVHITNSLASPPIDDFVQTDNGGHIILPAARISDGDHLVITKNGYETIETMDASSTFTPVYGHINVVSGFLNTYNYFQNRISKLTVKSADFQENPIGSIGFSIGGGKIIGHDELGNNVFSMASTQGTTNSTTGEKEYSNISSGNYTVIPISNEQYEFIDYSPSQYPFSLASGSDSTLVLRMADKNVNSLFLEIKEMDGTQAPVAGARVTMSDGSTDVFVDKLSSQRGIVFYPDGVETLENKEYTLKVEADGYASETKSITIDKLTHTEVQLTRI